jgi:hypothetical protein
MSLRDKLKGIKPTQVEITVCGTKFLVVGLSKTKRAEVYASVSKPGKSIDADQMENAFLSECVVDPDTQQPVFSREESSEWGGVPAQITGPLFGEVMRLNGLDNDDVGRKVKNSDATDLPA